MKKIPFYITEAFTVKPFGGNPTAVFINCEGLSEEEIKLISRELKIECVSIIEEDGDECDLSMRYFNPKIELTFSGHATIAAVYTYVNVNPDKLKEGSKLFKIKTVTSGIVNVKAEKDISGRIECTLHIRPPKFKSTVQPKEIANALNISKRAIDISNSLPMIVNCGADVLVVPIRNIIDIKSIQPDFSETTILSRNHRNYGPVIFQQDEEDKHRIMCRFFYPVIGPDEDIVSGLSIAAISCYMVKHNFVPKADNIEIHSEQGFIFNRQTNASCVMSMNGDQIEDVTIKGKSITMFESIYYQYVQARDRKKPEMVSQQF